MVNHTRVSLFLLLLGMSLLPLLWLPTTALSGAAETQSPGDGSLLFIENTGQFAPDVRFLVRAGDQTLWRKRRGGWRCASPSTAPIRRRHWRRSAGRMFSFTTSSALTRQAGGRTSRRGAACVTSISIRAST